MTAHLHFVQALDPLRGGGLASAALALHTELRRQGHASHLLSTNGVGEELCPVPGVETFSRTWPARFFRAPGLRSVAAQRVAAAEVVHAHGFYGYPSKVLGAEARRQQRPLVCHPHGFFDPWILRRSRLKKRLVGWWFEDANFRAARLWRALTVAEADQVKALGLPAPIEVIPNGLDLEALAAEAGPGKLAGQLPADRRKVVFMSRLHPKKGLGLLLTAWAQLEGFHRDWVLLLAGPDEGGYRATLEQQVATLGLRETVRFLGPVRGADRHALFTATDIFVLPSLSEGLPVVILEALAFRCATLLTTACNLPEIAAADAAITVTPDATAIRDGLHDLLSASSAQRTALGERGRQLVEARFTVAEVARQLADACDQHLLS